MLIPSRIGLGIRKEKEDEIIKIIDKYRNNFLRASIDIGTNSCRLFIAEVLKDNKFIDSIADKIKGSSKS